MPIKPPNLDDLRYNKIFFRLPKVDSTVYKGLDEFQCCGSWDYTDADVFLDDRNGPVSC